MRIVIDKSRLKQTNELSDVLEKLYLGVDQNYQLCIEKSDLPRVDEIFDKIISQHGIRSVNFDYLITSREIQRPSL